MTKGHVNMDKIEALKTALQGALKAAEEVVKDEALAASGHAGAIRGKLLGALEAHEFLAKLTAPTKGGKRDA